MEQVAIFILKVFRKLYGLSKSMMERLSNKKKDPYRSQLYEVQVELFDQSANDYVRNLLLSGVPCMISKFGIIELSALIQQKYITQKKYRIHDFTDYITGKLSTIWWSIGINGLCSNAGFFPNDVNLLSVYYRKNIEAMKQIDVLGSYLYQERFFEKELSSAKKINLDGYYAPFYYVEPWTIALKNKKVLVIHPFAESIKQQYARRELLWDDKNILPEFSLITYQSVQSMLSIKTDYSTWFDALKKMENDISKIDFDIAIIGCGAYGMPLAAYIKKMGKQAIHLAGWTQVLFGIKGKRWEDMPQVAKYMNDYWIRPSKKEVPQESKKVEGGCYW